MKAALFSLLISYSLALSGQNSIDLLTASYRYGAIPREMGETGPTNESIGFLNIKVPVVLSKKLVLFNDLTYQVSFLGNYSDTISQPDLVGLHGIVLPTGLILELDKSRALYLLAVPRFMSDMVSPDLSHFQIGGIGMFEKKYSARFTMRYGLMFNQELSGPMLVPLVYLDWHPLGRWSITGLLPISAKVNFQVNEQLIAGFSHFGMISSYQLGDPSFDGEYMERERIDLTLFARYRIYGNFHLEGRAGYAFGRGYTRFSGDDEWI